MIKLNKVETLVTPFLLAVGGTSGKQRFYLNTSLLTGNNPDRISEANSLVNADFGNTIRKESIETDTISIDDFAERNNLPIDFIKLDAEGAEKEILKGAARTILRDRPSGVVSVHNFSFATIQTNSPKYGS